MKLGTAHVPAEILLSITQHLPVKDIQNVRLTCKELEAVASRFLLTKLWISPDSKDQQKMLAVSQHPVFSHTIEEISYDATQSIRHEPIEFVAFSQAQYVRSFCNDWIQHDLGFSITKAAAIRGYKRYKERRDEEDAAAAYTGHDSTRPCDRERLPGQFSLLLEQPASHQEIVNYLPSDLATLIKALPQMPKVRRFIISDCRYSRTHDHCSAYDQMDGYEKDVAFSFEHRGVRGADAFVLKPRPWAANDEDYAPFMGRQAHRGFPVMMQAASMIGMVSLKSLSIERHSEASGLSYQVFDMSPSELHHTLRAFGHLRNLTLKLNTIKGPGASPGGLEWSDAIGKGSLAQACMAAQGLEKLDIQLDGPGTIAEEYGPPTKVLSLEKLIGTSVWPQLASVTLGWMMIPEKEFLAFFDRHRETLCHLFLNEVTVFPDSVSTDDAVRQGGPEGSLHGVFKAMAQGGSKLHHLRIKNDPDEDLDWPCAAGIHFESADRAAILRFLGSGGVVGNHFRPHGYGCLCSPVSEYGSEVDNSDAFSM